MTPNAARKARRARIRVAQQATALRASLYVFESTLQPGDLPRAGREIRSLLENFSITLGAYSSALDRPGEEAR